MQAHLRVVIERVRRVTDEREAIGPSLKAAASTLSGSARTRADAMLADIAEQNLAFRRMLQSLGTWFLDEWNRGEFARGLDEAA